MLTRPATIATRPPGTTAGQVQRFASPGAHGYDVVAALAWLVGWRTLLSYAAGW